MTVVDRCTVLTLAVVVAASGTASAQSAEAEVLFREGRRLIKQGKLATGCDKLAASERLESSVGTLLNLGDCREKLGKVATAWAAFEKARALAHRAGNDERRENEAKRRAQQLEPRLPMLVIKVERPVDGLVIRRGEVVIDPGAWSTAVPVDAGTYTIVAEAPGHRRWSTDVAVLHKTKRVLVVPALERVPAVAAEVEVRGVDPVPTAPAAPVRASSAIVVPSASMALTAGPTPSRWTGTRRLAVGVGVLGVGALGAGVYFGMRARDLQDRADARCPLTACSDPEGLRLNDEAQDQAGRANLMFVAGGVAAASSIVLWLVGSPSSSPVVRPSFASDRVGLSFTGSF